MAGAHDELAGVFTPAGLKAEGLLTPRRLGRGTVVLAAADAVAAAVTAAVRVIGRIHNNTAD